MNRRRPIASLARVNTGTITIATPREANVHTPLAAVYLFRALLHASFSTPVQSLPANQLMVIKDVFPDKKPGPNESKNDAKYTVGRNLGGVEDELSERSEFEFSDDDWSVSCSTEAIDVSRVIEVPRDR